MFKCPCNHPRGMVCGKSKPSCSRKFSLCKLLWSGQGGVAEMHSPHLSQRGFSDWKRRGSPRFFFFFCLPGGAWHSFPSLYLSFSICNKLIQLLLLLKWRLSSPGRLFKRSWRHPESHTTFSPHICAFSSAELGVSGKTRTITSFYVWNDPRSWVLCQLAEAQRSDSSSSMQHTAPHPLSPSPLIRACDLAAEFGHNL